MGSLTALELKRLNFTNLHIENGREGICALCIRTRNRTAQLTKKYAFCMR